MNVFNKTIIFVISIALIYWLIYVLRNQTSSNLNINIKKLLLEIKNNNNESVEEQQLIQLTKDINSIDFIEPSMVTGMEFFVPIDHLIRYHINDNNKLIAIYA